MGKANDKTKIKKWRERKTDKREYSNKGELELKYLLFFSGNSWDFVLHSFFSFSQVFFLRIHLFNFEMLTCCSFAFGIRWWEKGGRLHSIDVNTWILIFPGVIIQHTNILNRMKILVYFSGIKFDAEISLKPVTNNEIDILFYIFNAFCTYARLKKTIWNVWKMKIKVNNIGIYWTVLNWTEDRIQWHRFKYQSDSLNSRIYMERN